MSAQPKSEKSVEKSQPREPAKGGTNPPHDKAYPSGDSPKPHGDKLERAVDEAARQKAAG